MFPDSVNRNIENNLKKIVLEMETENPHFSVLAARQFRYILQQKTVEITVKEPRQFNVLEEFIIRAGLEFASPPTANQLASILGLDVVFIKSTISTLQALQTLAVDSTIQVTSEGRLFYEQGTVPQPPYTIIMYAIFDNLEENLSFSTESFDDDVLKLPDLADFINIENKNVNISDFKLEKIQKIIQESGLNFHLPEEGKLVTGFQVIPPTKNVATMISIFVIFDSQENGFIIQAHNGKQLLQTASKKLTFLLKEDKISLTKLSDLPDENFVILNSKF